MNLGAGRVVFRHRSTMDVLDLAARFLVQERRAFLLLSAAVLLPAWALVMLVAHGAGNWEGALFLAGLFAVTADLPFTLLASRLEGGGRLSRTTASLRPACVARS